MMLHMDKLLKPKEVAEILSLSRWTVYQWIRAGRIEAVRLPDGRLRVPARELRKVVRRQRPAQPNPGGQAV